MISTIRDHSVFGCWLRVGRHGGMQEIAYSPWLLRSQFARPPFADLDKPAAKLNQTDGTPMG